MADDVESMPGPAMYVVPLGNDKITALQFMDREEQSAESGVVNQLGGVSCFGTGMD